MKRDDKDIETLKPHANVHKDGHDEHDQQITTDRAEPEQLRDDTVTNHHGPISPCVRTNGSVQESVALVVTTTVPSDVNLS